MLIESSVILKYAGRDATKAYSEVHTPGLLKAELAPEQYKGKLDESTIHEDWNKQPASENPEAVWENDRPPLETLINSHDFEHVASRTASKKTWAFYSSAATDLITRDANKSCFDRIWFRPRVLRNVRSVDTKSKILGVDLSMPLFVSPAAMAKLIHQDGERAIARACESRGIMQGVRNGKYVEEDPWLTNIDRYRITPLTRWKSSRTLLLKQASSSNYMLTENVKSQQHYYVNAQQTLISRLFL